MTKQDIQGIGILLFVGFAIASLFALKYAISTSADDIDPETLCRIGHNDPVTKVLIDKTDPWNENSRQRLARLIASLKINLAQHERLSIYILDETGTYSPTPVFDMCNPGRGDQASELYQNPRLIQKRYEEQFSAPLDEILETLLKPGSAPRSPILETMHGLRGTGEERLVVVSDMMQNSEELTFYGQSILPAPEVKDEVCAMNRPYQSVDVFTVNRANIKVSKKQEVRSFWSVCLEGIAWQVDWRTL